jgi:hypothetical protein
MMMSESLVAVWFIHPSQRNLQEQSGGTYSEDRGGFQHFRHER